MGHPHRLLCAPAHAQPDERNPAGMSSSSDMSKSGSSSAPSEGKLAEVARAVRSALSEAPAARESSAAIVATSAALGGLQGEASDASQLSRARELLTRAIASGVKQQSRTSQWVNRELQGVMGPKGEAETELVAAYDAGLSASDGRLLLPEPTGAVHVDRVREKVQAAAARVPDVRRRKELAGFAAQEHVRTLYDSSSPEDEREKATIKRLVTNAKNSAGDSRSARDDSRSARGGAGGRAGRAGRAAHVGRVKRRPR